MLIIGYETHWTGCGAGTHLLFARIQAPKNVVGGPAAVMTGCVIRVFYQHSAMESCFYDARLPGMAVETGFRRAPYALKRTTPRC